MDIRRRGFSNENNMRETDGGGPDVQRCSLDGTEKPSAVVIRAVAAVVNRPPLEMPPLHATLDPDALDSLFRRGDDGGLRIHGRYRFTYNGCEITLEGDQVAVRGLDRE